MEEKKDMRGEMLGVILGELSAPNAERRIYAIESLVMSSWDASWTPAELLGAGGLSKVIDRLADPEPQVRAAAAQVIGAIAKKGGVRDLNHTNAVSVLISMLGDDSDQVRKDVQAALEAIEQEHDSRDLATTAPL
jgi:HEAT repeat protein